MTKEVFPSLSEIDFVARQKRIVLRGTELEFVIMVIAVSCVKLLSAHNSTQHTSRKHKV
jgi:hypothetical protein